MRGSAGNPGAAGAPEEPQILERRTHLVAAQEEHVFLAGEERVRCEQRPEFPHLVPEKGVIPVIDVVVVVLNVREDGASELELLVEGCARLLR